MRLGQFRYMDTNLVWRDSISVRRATLVACDRNPMLVEPVGVSRAEFGSRSGTFRCDVCGRKMKQVEQDVVLANLPLPQKVAHQLRRIRVDGWRCPGCQPYFDHSTFHLRVSPLNYWKEERFCAVCQELTVETVEERTLGQPLLIQTCYCCELLKKLKEKEESILVDCQNS